MAARILVVDDQRSIADTLCEILNTVGYECSVAYNATDALARVRDLKPALIITDVIMPGASGIDLAKKIRELDPHCAILLSSGNAATEQLLDLAHAEGHTFRVLAKPVPPQELLNVVAGMLAGA